MPDLIPRPFYYCTSVYNFSTQVGQYTVKHGPSNGFVQYDWSCTCKGFKFRGKCKHIETAKTQYCGWDQFIHGNEPVECCGERTCPECGEEAEVRMVGV